MFNRSILKSFGAACVCLSLAPAPVLAEPVGDVLETPAMESRLADQVLLSDIAVAGDRLVTVGTRGHILYSDDQGGTWSQAEVPVSTLMTGVHFSDAHNGWAVGHGAVILRSRDGGESWEKQLDGYRAADLTIATLEDQVAELEARLEAAPESEQADLEMQLDELLFSLDDARYDAESGPWKPLLDVRFLNDREGFAIGSYGLFFHTRDGGETWDDVSLRLDNPNRSHLNAMTQVTGGALFIVGEYGLLFRSTDRGGSWERVDEPYSGSFFGVTGTENVNEVLAFGLRGNVFRSTNLGRTWQDMTMPEDQTLMGAASGEGDRLVLVGNNGLVAISENAGESFRAYTRDDRESLLGVHVRDDGRLVLVGETGAVVAESNGLDPEH